MTEQRRKLIQEVMESMSTLKASLYHGHGPMFMKHGIGKPHFKLMMKMAASDEGVSVSKLSEALGITPGAVTQFIDRLVDKGLVERYEDPKDRRVVRIKLTDKSKTRFKKMKEFHFERLSNLFKNLNDDELEQLATLIKKIDPDCKSTDRSPHKNTFSRTK